MSEVSNIITLCPKCLKKISLAKGTVQCPQYNNLPVCMAHCYNGCNYFDKSMSLARCTFGRIKQDREGEIEHKKIGLR